MKFLFDNGKGFTLVEIIATSLIVGMLGMIAIPSMLKSVNHSYAQDVMHNLTAMYAAQQNYYQNNRAYKTCDSNLALKDCINDSDTGLGLSVVSTAGGDVTYGCDSATLSCEGIAGSKSGNFRMKIDLSSPITANSSPVYCSSVPGAINPCCVDAVGTLAGKNCPN